MCLVLFPLDHLAGWYVDTKVVFQAELAAECRGKRGYSSGNCKNDSMGELMERLYQMKWKGWAE